MLQAKYKRKFDVAMNPGHSQLAPVGNGPNPWYPDLVLQATEKTRKLQGVVEVETAESVNHLEAMSQWATFSKFRVLFHLYVPATSVDTARRLCTDLHIQTDEIWAYHTVGDQLRFALVQRSAAAEAAAKAAAASAGAADETATRPLVKRVPPASPAVSVTVTPVAARKTVPVKPTKQAAPVRQAVPAKPVKKSMPVKAVKKPAALAKSAAARRRPTSASNAKVAGSNRSAVVKSRATARPAPRKATKATKRTTNSSKAQKRK